MDGGKLRGSQKRILLRKLNEWGAGFDKELDRQIKDFFKSDELRRQMDKAGIEFNPATLRFIRWILTQRIGESFTFLKEKLK